MSLTKYNDKNFEWRQTVGTVDNTADVQVTQADARRVAIVLTPGVSGISAATINVNLGGRSGGVVAPFLSISQGSPFAVITRDILGKLIGEALWLMKATAGTQHVVITEILDNTPPS